MASPGYQSQFMQSYQQGSPGGDAAPSSEAYLYDESIHGLKATESGGNNGDDDAPAIPPRNSRGRGRSRVNPAVANRKEERLKKQREMLEREQMERQTNMMADVSLGMDAAEIVEKKKTKDKEEQWKHKNTRDMSDLWTSPEREGSRAKRALPSKGEMRSQSFRVEGIAGGGGGEHWSKTIKNGFDEDNKLSVLQQRMASRQQQRHSKSAGTMMPSADGSRNVAVKGVFNSQTKVSASVDASTIKYRAQTTPDYSPRMSPRAQAAAERSGAGRAGRRQSGGDGVAKGGKGRRKKKELPEWNMDTSVDTDEIYGSMEADGNEPVGAGDKAGAEDDVWARGGGGGGKKPEWNSDFVGGGSEVEVKDSFARKQRERREQREQRDREATERREQSQREMKEMKMKRAA